MDRLRQDPSQANGLDEGTGRTMTLQELLRPLNEVERKNAPPRLFVGGNPELFRKPLKIAVVGARRASEEGLRRAARLTRALVDKGVLVISGLAEGIDTAAHETAISCGGQTAAVLGSSLAEAYPARNRKLQDLILQEHVAVSQFPPGYPVLRTNFPQRNRTMALLSDATVIVEATDGSGSLSQGWEAIRLGRPLFLLRSLVEDPSLSWPAELISYGAEVLREPEEIFLVLPFEAELPAESLAF